MYDNNIFQPLILMRVESKQSSKTLLRIPLTFLSIVNWLLKKMNEKYGIIRETASQNNQILVAIVPPKCAGQTINLKTFLRAMSTQCRLVKGSIQHNVFTSSCIKSTHPINSNSLSHGMSYLSVILDIFPKWEQKIYTEYNRILVLM